MIVLHKVMMNRLGNIYDVIGENRTKALKMGLDPKSDSTIRLIHGLKYVQTWRFAVLVTENKLRKFQAGETRLDAEDLFYDGGIDHDKFPKEYAEKLAAYISLLNWERDFHLPETKMFGEDDEDQEEQPDDNESIDENTLKHILVKLDRILDKVNTLIDKYFENKVTVQTIPIEPDYQSTSTTNDSKVRYIIVNSNCRGRHGSSC